MNSPLVTCLCLTRNRREWLPKAIACYQQQTYANKELLIVADTQQDIEGLIPSGENIRALVLDKQGVVVGTKRNLGCEVARGEVIAIWDDDDHSESGRLRQQVGMLELTGKTVTGYHSMKFTDGSSWWLYRGGPTGFAMATSLCFRRAWWQQHRFESIQCGQDENFMWAAARVGQLAECPDLDLMYATIHASNTSPRKLNQAPYVKLPGFEWPVQQAVEEGVMV